MAMVDTTIALLSEGWLAMSPAEQKAFLLIYDPASTGEVDEEFVEKVFKNYQKVRTQLENPVPVVYEPESEMCIEERLYYTDIVKLHICPYFLIEDNNVRRVRTLIHELAHIALLVIDRPYYNPESPDYAALTPYGSPANQLPLIGPIIRELTRGDTLHHPDAYAHFAVAVSGQPGAIERYLGNDA
jgi:hypothetical protein